MQIKLHQPEHTSLQETAALVLVNHAGSTAEADSGRDAQYLATHFGLPTFAVDRPGSGHVGRSYLLREQLARNYSVACQPLARELQSRLDETGIDRITVLGRSAGSLGVLALAATDLLPVKSVYCADGIGWSQRTVQAGQKEHASLMAAADKALRDDYDHEFVHPHGPQLGPARRLQRLISMARCSRAEWNSYDVWASGTGLRLLGRLAGTADEPAETRPDIWIDVPEFGLTSPSDVVAMRAAAPLADIEVVTTPRTVHASFDNRQFFCQRAEPAVQYLLAAI